MIIKPFSSFTGAADEAVANFPKLSLFWHMDDFTPSGGDENTWIDRVSGVQLAFTAGTPGSIMRKDSEGVYADAAQTIVVTGTMPTITAADYIALISIGKTTTSSTVNGLAVTLGVSQASKLSMTTAGAITYNAAALNTVPALSPTALTTTNRLACGISYADFVDTTSPRIDRILSNDNFTAAASLAFGSGTTTSTNAITPGQFANALSLTGLGGGFDERQTSFGLFIFANPVSYAELKIAATESARTRRLPAIFRNRI